MAVGYLLKNGCFPVQKNSLKDFKHTSSGNHSVELGDHLVMSNIAIEHGHLVSWFAYESDDFP